jgi:hypothetical protein
VPRTTLYPCPTLPSRAGSPNPLFARRRTAKHLGGPHLTGGAHEGAPGGMAGRPHQNSRVRERPSPDPVRRPDSSNALLASTPPGKLREREPKTERRRGREPGPSWRTVFVRASSTRPACLVHLGCRAAAPRRPSVTRREPGERDGRSECVDPKANGLRRVHPRAKDMKSARKYAPAR